MKFVKPTEIKLRSKILCTGMSAVFKAETRMVANAPQSNDSRLKIISRLEMSNFIQKT